MSIIHFESIGIIRTPFVDKYAAPSQPVSGDTGAIGRVILDKGKNFEQALDDLAGFEKLWLLYHFDRNTNWKPKVLPPRSDVKRGVFATRSPHRPNPIGLSVVTLLDIRGRTLDVQGVDILDKTPLLDIKPYLPYAEAHPDVRTGWLSDTEPRVISYSEEAERMLNAMNASESRAIRDHIERMLRYSIVPHPYKRITESSDGTYTLAWKAFRIVFRVHDKGHIAIQMVVHS